MPEHTATVPASLRQRFYQLVSQGAIAKTEEAWQQFLSEMREDRQVPSDN